MSIQPMKYLFYEEKKKKENLYCCKCDQSHFLWFGARTGMDSHFWLKPGSFSLSSFWWPVGVSFVSSLKLVGELFAMPVDPDRGSDKASQKSSSCPKGTGNGPNLHRGATKSKRSKLSYCRSTSDWLQILQIYRGVLPTKFLYLRLLSSSFFF